MLKWFQSLFAKPPLPPLLEGEASDTDVLIAVRQSLRERPEEWELREVGYSGFRLYHRSGAVEIHADNSVFANGICVAVNQHGLFESHPEVARRVKETAGYRNQQRLRAIASLSRTSNGDSQ